MIPSCFTNYGFENNFVHRDGGAELQVGGGGKRA